MSAFKQSCSMVLFLILVMACGKVTNTPQVDSAPFLVSTDDGYIAGTSSDFSSDTGAISNLSSANEENIASSPSASSAPNLAVDTTQTSTSPSPVFEQGECHYRVRMGWNTLSNSGPFEPVVPEGYLLASFGFENYALLRSDIHQIQMQINTIRSIGVLSTYGYIGGIASYDDEREISIVNLNCLIVIDNLINFQFMGEIFHPSMLLGN